MLQWVNCWHCSTNAVGTDTVKIGAPRAWFSRQLGVLRPDAEERELLAIQRRINGRVSQAIH
jgi:hypothetical protein